MLNFHLSSGDIGRIRMAEGLDPLWEVTTSLYLYQNREATLAFDPWRRQVTERIRRGGLERTVAALAHLFPVDGYAPDFLVPRNGSASLEEGLDQVLSTPRRQIAAQLTRFAEYRPHLPGWTGKLAEGELGTLKALGTAIRQYYRMAIAPYRPHTEQAADTDRRQRIRAMLSGGAEGLLSSFGQDVLRWRDGTLSASCPVDREVHTGGRPLTLVPSFFSAHPAAVVDDDLPLTLTYPVARPLTWLSPPPAGDSCAGLAQLIGPTRARILRLLDDGLSTSRLAAALDLSPATTSWHTAILREAGLISTCREGRAVSHRRSRLGTALLNGEPEPAA
ncbi:metalloregulator ArsR/SmtB family transcription factor [Kitasatospora sp. NPDC004799]|uniref:ArsR/SmtB family transcription factor n=1 Tax=Kitasatospora sp. NPDC004799 TaxID=3154460 RepID=UPI0033BB84DA